MAECDTQKTIVGKVLKTREVRLVKSDDDVVTVRRNLAIVAMREIHQTWGPLMRIIEVIEHVGVERAVEDPTRTYYQRSSTVEVTTETFRNSLRVALTSTNGTVG